VGPVWTATSATGAQKVSLPHLTSPLTPTVGLRLARCVVAVGRPARRAAERFNVSHTTAARWTGRYRHHGHARPLQPPPPFTPADARHGGSRGGALAVRAPHRTTPAHFRNALDDQFQGMPAEGVGWAAAEATARRSGGGPPALVVEVAAGGQASGSTSGCVNRTGLPSDRA
jgi:hypothetical protein